MSFLHWTAGSVPSTIRDYILAGHFTDHSAAIRLVAMSRFTPADHLDCIIASESAVPSQTPDSNNGPHHNSNHPHHHLLENPLQRLRYHLTRTFTSSSQHHRKYLSLALLLLLLSIFCLVSTSIIDVLNSDNASNSKYSNLKGINCLFIFFF